jgi:hypothetical protein
MPELQKKAEMEKQKKQLEELRKRAQIAIIDV